MLRRVIFKHLIVPKLVKAYTKWYFETRDWRKADWRNWVAEEFERLKMSPWTLRHYPQLKDITFEDLPNLPITEKYKEAPEDFPAAMTYRSTGTVAHKKISFTKNDLKKIVSSFGRSIWLVKGEKQFRNGLFMGFPGLGSGVFFSYIQYIFAKKSFFVIAGQWRKYVRKIIKKGPYDVLVLPIPYLVDFVKNFDTDVFEDIAFWVTGGDVVTEHIRRLIINRGIELDKIFYPVDGYLASECVGIGIELPPTITNALQYIPETNIALIKKDDGRVINIFDAKPGDRGEILITPLFEYMVPNFPLYDIIEIVSDETKYGLPALRVLGRIGVRVDMELKTLGHIRGYFSMYVRVMGIIIDGFVYTNLLGEKFDTDHVTLIHPRGNKVIMRTYTEKPISKDSLLEAIKRDEKIYYLYDDIVNELLEIEVIHSPEVLDEIKEYCYTKYGPQATLPRMIILEREE